MVAERLAVTSSVSYRFRITAHNEIKASHPKTAIQLLNPFDSMNYSLTEFISREMFMPVVTGLTICHQKFVPHAKTLQQNCCTNYIIQFFEQQLDWSLPHHQQV